MLNGFGQKFFSENKHNSFAFTGQLLSRNMKKRHGVTFIYFPTGGKIVWLLVNFKLIVRCFAKI